MLQGNIELIDGNGGIQSRTLIENLFYKYFDNSYLRQNSDAVCLELEKKQITFTTDSYVVTPLFFPGGDIGKLAVCGTVNDLAVRGSKPLFLSCSIIIEEGFSKAQLEQIVQSMCVAAQEAEVQIVTGDTKVVPKGKGDGIYINTSGIGVPYEKVTIEATHIKAGDDVIVTGTLGDHEVALLLAREELPLQTVVKSDCAALNKMLGTLCEKFGKSLHMMRDPTRGGVATVLNEIVSGAELGIEIEKEKLPLNSKVTGICELLGLDPLYSANEGKAVIVCESAVSQKVIECLHTFKQGSKATIIGKVVKEHSSKVWVKTLIGTYYSLRPLSLIQLPRIC